MKTKRFLSILLTLTMVLGLLPSFAVSASTAQEPVLYIDENGDEQYCTDYTVLTNEYISVSGNRKLTTGWYVINSNISRKFRFTVTGNVHLILIDECKLDCAGITVTQSNTLNVYGQKDGTGILKCDAGSQQWAGIGGVKEPDDNAGSIKFNGGIVEASSSDYNAASIGGGVTADPSAQRGSVVVNGGLVYAKKTKYGEAIGGGVRNHGCVTKQFNSGLVYDGDSGKVYKGYTFNCDYTLPGNLSVPSGTTLTVADGVTLTNKKTVTVDGTLTVNGKLTNTGTLRLSKNSDIPRNVVGGTIYLGDIKCVWDSDITAYHRISNDWTTENDSGMHRHYHACLDSGCEKRFDETTCTADGTATCLKDVHCKYCKQFLQDKAPINHESTKTYYKKIDETNHGEYYVCCGELKSTATHTAGDTTQATCTGAAVCSVCKSSYGGTDGKNHSSDEYEYVDVGYGHMKKYKCCQGQEDFENHIPTFSTSEDGTTLSAVCSVCSCNLGSTTIEWSDCIYDGNKHSAEHTYGIKCAYGSNTLFITYWQGETLIDDSTRNYGVSNAGEYDICLGTRSNPKMLVKKGNINKRELEIDYVKAREKAYDGTNEVDIMGVVFKDIPNGEELSSGVTGTVVVDGCNAGEYSTVTGIETVTAYASTIADYYGDNYTVKVSQTDEIKLKGEYSDTFEISPRTVYITAENQTITEGGELDQTKYTLEGMLEDERYTLSGILLEKDEYLPKINVNAQNAKVTFKENADSEETDVTKNFDFSYTYQGNLSVVCEGHRFDDDGFCSTGSCSSYEAPEYTTDEYMNKTYLITNAGQLYWYADQVNNYSGGSNGAILMNDIVVPKSKSNGGTIADWSPINNLYANFDGNGYTVSGLYCKSDSTYVGMFGSTGYYPIHDLMLTDCYFESTHTSGVVGAIAGYSQTVISNCAIDNTVTVKGSGYQVGGLVGSNAGTLENCYAVQDKVLGSDSGPNYSTVRNCYYLGTEETDSLDGTTAMTADDFKSGKVAYLLQNGVAGEGVYDDDYQLIDTVYPHIWGQKIDKDNYPILSGDKVYKYELGDDTVYMNTEVDLTRFAILSNGTDGGKATATVCVPTAGTYTLIFAKYDGDTFSGCDIVEFKTEADKCLKTVPSEKAITLKQGDKIFLWKDLETLTPMCEEYTIK